MPQVEPEPTVWDLGAQAPEPGEDLVAIGADLDAGTLLAAYRQGLFPMGLGDDGAPPIGWWSPDPRGVIEPGDLRISRSLRRSRARYTCTVDRDFTAVMAACGDASRSGRWITPAVERAYGRLHDLGWAHSVEVWAAQPGERLVGGLYGVSLGGVFCGESMFHRERDASKVALAHLVDVLTQDGVERLVEVQWVTDHLASLGATGIPREAYLLRLPRLLALPHAPAFATA